MIKFEVVQAYFDIVKGRMVSVGEILTADKVRADMLVRKKLVKLVVKPDVQKVVKPTHTKK